MTMIEMVEYITFARELINSKTWSNVPKNQST